MQLLSIQLSAFEESSFIINAQSKAGEATSRSSLPFYENTTKWRTTLIKILEIGKFSLAKFSDEEKIWMAQESLLLSDGNGFSADYLEKIGRSLYKALFPTGEVSDLLQRSIALAEKDSNPQLHIQIKFSAKVTELNRLPDYPWEMVHDGQRFLAHHNVTFSRYIAHLSAPPKLSAVSPINVLLVSSGASDEENGLAPLSKKEHEAVKKGLEKSQEDGHIRFREPEQASFKALEIYLTEHRGDDAPHVLHFDGHGVFGKRCQNSECRTFYGNLNLTQCKKCKTALSAPQGYLLFEPDEDDDDEREANYVSAEEIGSLLRSIRHGDSESQQGGVRLAVLSACKSAYALGGDSVFNGVAQSLIWHGVPAVVAMQYTVSVQSATAFANRFYRELGNKQSLAVATSQGREAMRKDQNQWYRLIFYLRWQANDGGQLFATEDLSTRKNKIANLFKVPDLPKRSLPRDEDVAALKELVLGESANKLVMTGVA
ncbi:MAG: CHAT domain-containing protein, partial [Pseudanabaena sp. ELA607]